MGKRTKSAGDQIIFSLTVSGQLEVFYLVKIHSPLKPLYLSPVFQARESSQSFESFIDHTAKFQEWYPHIYAGFTLEIEMTDIVITIGMDETKKYMWEHSVI